MIKTFKLTNKYTNIYFYLIYTRPKRNIKHCIMIIISYIICIFKGKNWHTNVFRGNKLYLPKYNKIYTYFRFIASFYLFFIAEILFLDSLFNPLLVNYTLFDFFLCFIKILLNLMLMGICIYFIPKIK